MLQSAIESSGQCANGISWRPPIIYEIKFVLFLCWQMGNLNCQLIFVLLAASFEFDSFSIVDLYEPIQTFLSLLYCAGCVLHSVFKRMCWTMGIVITDGNLARVNWRKWAVIIVDYANRLQISGLIIWFEVLTPSYPC